MILVTGGAGFIGSNVVAALNADGERDIVVCDNLATDGKWRNLQKAFIQDIVPIGELAQWLPGRSLSAVVHVGANSSTMTSDGDEVAGSNLRSSLRLLDWCTNAGIPLIYASSAATYGDGGQGFEDDASFGALRQLRPLNLYGWSKHMFDLVVSDRIERHLALPPICVGLKFFNVYGPNELHKGSMMSLISKYHRVAASGQRIELFRSYREGIADGDQRRDFVHVDDISDVVRWLLRSGPRAGIFNIGTGLARTFNDLIGVLFGAVGVPENVVYVDMPEALRDRYQYHTQADLSRLRRAGYDQPFLGIEEGVTRLVSGYLSKADPYR